MLQLKYNEKLDSMKTAEQRRQEKLQTLTFYNVADEWLEYTAPMVKVETVKNHINNVKRIKRAIPEDMPFLEFSPVSAEKVVYNMYYTEKLSYSYSNTILITIKAIICYAKKAGYIENISDFEEIKLKRRPVTKQELAKSVNKFLDKNELAECLKQLKAMNIRVGLAMEFIALTGLRCGEMLALRTQDYDAEKSSVNINGTLVKSACNGDDVQRGTPKNVYSYRDVILNDRARQILEWFMLENKKSAQWDRKTYKDKGYIFTTKSGNPYNIQYINKKLRELNLDNKKISTHVFRHTHISLLAEMGIPLKAIMQRVGHNDPNTTLSIYTHVTNKMKSELVNKLKAMHF
ncbi:site-specific integrase [Megamonas hypermegale]|uniref:tyrosine-type recombinase/integrase n=1 Tax=Megamonas hypermegale TaxID=158847 RepID=UPI00320A49D5